MADSLNIPAHKNCINCGDCCGIIPVTPKEVERILDFLDHHPEGKKIAQKQRYGLYCPFRDKTQKRCIIYPVRPVICRLMGVCRLMVCKQGNSADIDGSKFIESCDLSQILILNEIDWYQSRQEMEAIYENRENEKA